MYSIHHYSKKLNKGYLVSSWGAALVSCAEHGDVIMGLSSLVVMTSEESRVSSSFKHSDSSPLYKNKSFLGRTINFTYDLFGENHDKF